MEGNKITFNNKYEAKGTTASIGAVNGPQGRSTKDKTGKVIDDAKNDKGTKPLTGKVHSKSMTSKRKSSTIPVKRPLRSP